VARILHISDWHVGASLYRCDRSGDHAVVLDETAALAGEHRPDLILHTGDVFDALIPGHRAMRQAIDALTALAAVAPVIVLAGNHDHPRLFEVFATLRGGSGRLTFVPRVLPPSRGGIIDVEVAGGQRVRVAAVPFIHQHRFVDWFGEDMGAHATYADKLRAINGALRDGLLEGYDVSRDVLIYAAHLHVAGAVFGGSERKVHITEEYATGPDSIPAVSYAALGHIHKPQDVPGAVTAAYVGSPLPLDFGERGETKSLVLADCAPGRPAELQRLPLSGGRALRVLDGTFAEVRAAAATVGDAIVKVVVKTQDPLDGLVDHVRDLMPDATIVDIVEHVASRKLEAAHAGGEADREQTLDELFDDYLADRGTKTVSASTVKALWRAVQVAVAEDSKAANVDGLEDLLTCPLPTPEGVPA
jgi:exonuclease SbcD